ncbi:hydrolase [Salinigranum rubrum]|uniref:Hydrolase n=1 Tax=Salinigranum rubrum TaxID=755307 RepID=A0A2I8VIX1_9EURY|nr:MBL fold metallo-hydrolase [Salinigranum rubrum]AUV81868.1 hydrolase [Salinigranum rubrum]
MTVRHDGLSIDWFGYATARIETPDGFVVYLDPGRYGVLTGEWTGDSPAAEAAHPEPTDYHARDADLVCVTHGHHYDSDGVERVASEDATVLVHEAVDAEDIDRDVVSPEDLPYDVVRVTDDDHRAVSDGVDVWTVAAYNDPDGPYTRDDGSVLHPRGEGCGYLLSLDGTTVFWPGDSDAHDAFARLEVSLFLANISGSVCMDRHDAADLAEALDPDLVLPIHYNTRDFLEADSGAFASDVAKRGVPVVLDE